jgi:signal transduction histidine kinase
LADLVTWVLLISQFDIIRWHALLVVASGYLFTAMLAVPLLLTFPGAFTQTGLLGAGLQTNGWISAFWVSGYPLATIGYALLKNKEPGALVSQGSTRTGIVASVAVSIAIVFALTWIATAGEPYLPKLFLDRSRAAVDLRCIGALLLLLNAAALLLLWLRRRSATVLLIVLLTETMTLYARLAVSIFAQRREREGRMMTMEALAASIADELNQPLAAVVGNGSAGLRWLDRPVPDLSEARASLQRIVRDGH